MFLEGLKNLRDLIALGSLFHDIGKLKGRLEEKLSEEEQQQQHTEKEDSNEMEKQKDDYKYPHEKLGKEFVKDSLKELKFGRNFVNHLREVCKEYNLLKDCNSLEPLKVILAAFHHHSPENAGDYKFFAEIYQKADIISATERDKFNTDELQTKEKRLHSIFESVEVFEKYPKKEWVYRIEPLEVREETTSQELKQLIFPFPLGEQVEKPLEVRKYDKELYREIYGEYLQLFKDFREVLSKTVKGVNDISKFAQKVYYLFYKYLWSVPSSTYDRERKGYHYPDISLFDHSRGVAAISTSLITDYNLKLLKEKKEPYLILVEGDISGIQKFLFGVRNIKGVAKRLRARSFFLALLPELIARYILENLGYNPTINTLYASAGKFQLLIGYDEKVEKKLTEFQKEIEKILLEEFGGRLGFVLAWEKFPLNDLKNYREVVKKVQQKLANEKKRKFRLNFLNLNTLANKKIEKLVKEGKETILCPSCGWEIVEKTEEGEQKFCKWCETFQKVGTYLPKVRYIAFTRSEKQLQPEWKAHFRLPKLGTVYLLSEDNFKLLPTKGEKGKLYLSKSVEIGFSELRKELDISKLNATDIEGNSNLSGFKFICQAVPSLRENWENLKPLLEEEIEEREEWKEGDIIPFTILQELSLGDKKLGYFKADVDNLGLIFMAGIKNYSFSRIATLSRMLDLFFSLYVDRLLRDLKVELLNGDYKGREEGKYLACVESPVYTVFSGGDDLFLLAPWNIVIKVANFIREEFKEYTCENPNFGMSAGLGFFKGNFPIRLASDITDNLESLAKSKVEKNGKKDKIALLGSVLKWSELSELKNKAWELLKELENDNLSRSLLYRLYIRLKAIKETTEENSTKRKEELYRFVPYFYYQLARNVKNEEIQKKLEEIFIDPSKDELINLEESLVFLTFLLMLTRDLKKTHKEV